MGLSLYLCPIKHLNRGLFGNAHTVLDLGGLDWALGAQIKKCSRRLPDGHDIQGQLAARIKDGYHKGEPCYGRFVDDAYGEPYCWLTAKELLPFLEEHWTEHPITAYVRAMPSDGLIVLDWH
jgi:hypothetical protein